MIRGRVTEHGEPVIAFTLDLGPKSVRLPAVIDTGFNGYLSVPKALIRESNWALLGFEDFELASGAIVRERVYWGQVLFDRRRQEVYIVATDATDILIGTKLLQGRRLMIDFGSGEVRITTSQDHP